MNWRRKYRSFWRCQGCRRKGKKFAPEVCVLPQVESGIEPVCVPQWSSQVDLSLVGDSPFLGVAWIFALKGGIFSIGGKTGTIFSRSCVSSLVSLDLDAQSLELLQNLAFDMRTNCMDTLFGQAVTGRLWQILLDFLVKSTNIYDWWVCLGVELQCYFSDVESLHERETWHVEADDERGGTTLLVSHRSLMWCVVLFALISKSVWDWVVYSFTACIVWECCQWNGAILTRCHSVQTRRKTGR